MTRIFILLILLCYTFVAITPPAFAQVIGDRINLGSKQLYGIPASTTSIGTIVSNAVRIMFIAGGLAVLVFIIWGAFDWITSGGDKEKIAGARRKIVNALIGFALLALSAFIVSLAGQIAGFDPLNTSQLPRLDDPVK